MRLWRISNYADLSGLGGLRFSARWHSKGRPVLYTAEHPAGALAEFLVHIDLEDMPEHFQLLTINVESSVEPANLKPDDLGAGWISNIALTRQAGDHWLKQGKGLLLRVPSVLVPGAFNMLINPQHPDAASMRIVSAAKVPLDSRFGRR